MSEERGLPLHDMGRLAELAWQVRRDTVRMIFHAGSGLPVGSLGMADVRAPTRRYREVRAHSGARV